MLHPYLDPSFGPEDPEDFGRPGYKYDPNNPYMWFIIPYLDTDNDGKVSVRDLYDSRVVEILRSIFDGLDVNGNGVVEKLESNSTPSRLISALADIRLEPILKQHSCFGDTRGQRLVCRH